jgi:hypothetical protein
MQRAIFRGTLATVALLVLLYGGDYCSLRYRIPHGRPQFGQMTQNVLYVIHVKGGKVQYEPGEAQTVTCVHSLFPHLGSNPCWYSKRHPDKLIDI